ncbi:MAG TPA: hypothetical protein VKA43_08910 [Gammaproteobacteria bacterium]|nr:hypothetical protein [Gammaproteobacteria bacterium]
MRHGIPILLCTAALAAPAAAQPDPVAPEASEDERAVSFEVGTGLEYDSNVAVLDLDTSTNAGDLAALAEFGVDYDKPDAGPFDLTLGYNFSQSLHDDFGAFDVRVHRGSGTASFDLGRVDIGTTMNYAAAALDGDEFLAIAQISPYVSRLVGERLFLRFAYARSDKDFAGNPARDATADGFSSDAYVFLNGLRTYLVFGYRYDYEDAADAQFDYTGHKISAQLSRRIPAPKRELTLKTYLRYETRDYDSATPSIGAPRGDDRVQLETSLEVPLRERLITRFGYKHADNRSNLPSVDFDENVWSASISWTL